MPTAILSAPKLLLTQTFSYKTIADKIKYYSIIIGYFFTVKREKDDVHNNQTLNLCIIANLPLFCTYFKAKNFR